MSQVELQQPIIMIDQKDVEQHGIGLGAKLLNLLAIPFAISGFKARNNMDAVVKMNEQLMPKAGAIQAIVNGQPPEFTPESTANPAPSETPTVTSTTTSADTSTPDAAVIATRAPWQPPETINYDSPIQVPTGVDTATLANAEISPTVTASRVPATEIPTQTETATKQPTLFAPNGSIDLTPTLTPEQTGNILQPYEVVLPQDPKEVSAIEAALTTVLTEPPTVDVPLRLAFSPDDFGFDSKLIMDQHTGDFIGYLPLVVMKKDVIRSFIAPDGSTLNLEYPQGAVFFPSLTDLKHPENPNNWKPIGGTPIPDVISSLGLARLTDTDVGVMNDAFNMTFTSQADVIVGLNQAGKVIAALDSRGGFVGIKADHSGFQLASYVSEVNADPNAVTNPNVSNVPSNNPEAIAVVDQVFAGSHELAISSVGHMSFVLDKSFDNVAKNFVPKMEMVSDTQLAVAHDTIILTNLMQNDPSMTPGTEIGAAELDAYLAKIVKDQANGKIFSLQLPMLDPNTSKVSTAVIPLGQISYQGSFVAKNIAMNIPGGPDIKVLLENKRAVGTTLPLAFNSGSTGSTVSWDLFADGVGPGGRLNLVMPFSYDPIAEGPYVYSGVVNGYGLGADILQMLGIRFGLTVSFSTNVLNGKYKNLAATDASPGVNESGPWIQSYIYPSIILNLGTNGIPVLPYKITPEG